jgi:huntingtin
MPKVIQLCDGIMASGLDPTLHGIYLSPLTNCLSVCGCFPALPALQCIVHDLFALRGAAHKSDLGRDLETQREVVVSMLLRLIHHHQVGSLSL